MRQKVADTNWLTDSDPIAVAAELSRREPEKRAAIFQQLPAEMTNAVFWQLEPDDQAAVLDGLQHNQVIRLLESMDPDDRVHLFQVMPADMISRLMTQLSPRERRSTELLLAYPKETAGRIMNPEFIRLKPSMTVSAGLAEVRRHRDRAETIYVLPVSDDAMRLLGTVSLEDLVLAEPRQRIEKLIRQPQYSVSAWDDQETTARLIQSADLVAVPVVEKDNRLVGLVTVDDAMDVLQSEDSEDMARAGATEPIGRAYFSVSLIRLVRSRIVWLSLLALAATLTVNVLSAFETTLETAVSLALFIPLLIGIGGNTGAQSATTIIRAIAIEEIDTSDLLRVLLREGLVGLILGVLLGVIAFVVVSTIFDRDIALIVALTLVTICTLAAIVGSSMPLFARILGVDPAVVSAPVVTTVVDATGLLVYFLVAAAVLGL
jgi:magnesium transporter